MANHTVTITIATGTTNFVPGTVGPASVLVHLYTSEGVDFAPPVTASGSPLTAVFSDVPDGSYTMTAVNLDGNGNEVPSTDANGNPVQVSVSGSVVVTDPPVTLTIATGITAVIS